MKLQFMIKQGEGVAGATRSSHDLAGKFSETYNTLDEDWQEIDLKVASTIQLCLADKVMYNLMDEETTTILWSMLDFLYDEKPLQ